MLCSRANAAGTNCTSCVNGQNSGPLRHHRYQETESSQAAELGHRYQGETKLHAVVPSAMKRELVPSTSLTLMLMLPPTVTIAHSSHTLVPTSNFQHAVPFPTTQTVLIPDTSQQFLRHKNLSVLSVPEFPILGTSDTLVPAALIQLSSPPLLHSSSVMMRMEMRMRGSLHHIPPPWLLLPCAPLCARATQHTFPTSPGTGSPGCPLCASIHSGLFGTRGLHIHNNSGAYLLAFPQLTYVMHLY